MLNLEILIHNGKIFIACKSDPAKLPKINFSVALLTENSRSCRLDLGPFLAYLMALKAAADVNLGVKAIMDVKKSAKANKDVKPLESTLTRSVD